MEKYFLEPALDVFVEICFNNTCRFPEICFFCFEKIFFFNELFISIRKKVFVLNRQMVRSVSYGSVMTQVVFHNTI